MVNNTKNSTAPSAITGKYGERIIRKENEAVSAGLANRSAEEIVQMFQEVQAYQLELEMQNKELRSTQAALEASQQRLAALYDDAPVGYVTENEAGLIIEANTTAATALGVDKSSLFRWPLAHFIHPEDQDIYALHRKKLFETQASQVSEVRMCPPEMSPFWARLESRCADETSGMPICRVIMSDITACKLAEQERQKLKDQAVQAQKMESIERLAGGVANDFNNMLGIILGHAEMALDHANPDQPLFVNLQEISRAVDRSAQLTWQLLSFARMQIVATDGLNLNKTVEGLLSTLRCLIGKGIELAWRPEADLWPVTMDPGQIEEVLVHLCGNARDAITDSGCITIETRNTTLDLNESTLHPGCSPGGYVVLIVSDTGCGITQDAPSKLFEPFFTTKEAGRGNGLGLAIVHGIVKQNSGFINVLCKQPQGAVFEIFLPRHPAHADQLSQASRESLPPNNHNTSDVANQRSPPQKVLLPIEETVPSSAKFKAVH